MIDQELPGWSPVTRRHHLLVIAALFAGVVALVVLTMVGVLRGEPQPGHVALDVTVGVAACALLPTLIRWPIAGALVISLLAVLSPAATPPATASLLVLAQRRPFPVAAVVAASGVIAHIGQMWWRRLEGISFGWWIILVVAGYAAVLGWGALGRTRRALIMSLRERARRAEAERDRTVAAARVTERARIAREMHDVLAHRLSLVATYAGALEYRPDSPPEQLARAAGVVRSAAHQALDELRDVIDVLRSGDDTGDETAGRPQPALADIPRLIGEARDAGQRVIVDDRVPDPVAAPEIAGRTAYRVVQEALTNARKHAAGQPVRVTLSGAPGRALVIDVVNPLADAVTPPAVTSGGVGLIGLTERVQLAGGALTHEVAAGEFRLHARLRWPE